MTTTILLSCEDVIDVDLKSEAPRLVVDGVIRISDLNESPFFVEIRVSESSDFFEEPVPAQLNQITITNLESNGTITLLEEPLGSGMYRRSASVEFLTSGDLVLQINHKNNLYVAETRFVPSVPIDSLIQGEETLFGEDETEIIISFTDNPNRNDFYVFDFDFDEYLVTEDEFYQGQKFEFSYFYDNEIEPGRIINIGLLGVDESFYNYMNQLIVQSGGDQGPFQTPAATVRGNIINVTNLDNRDVFDNVNDPNNFALGYFAVVQEFNKSIEIE